MITTSRYTDHNVRYQVTKNIYNTTIISSDTKLRTNTVSWTMNARTKNRINRQILRNCYKHDEYENNMFGRTTFSLMIKTTVRRRSSARPTVGHRRRYSKRQPPRKTNDPDLPGLKLLILSFTRQQNKKTTSHSPGIVERLYTAPMRPTKMITQICCILNFRQTSAVRSYRWKNRFLQRLLIARLQEEV